MPAHLGATPEPSCDASRAITLASDPNTEVPPPGLLPYRPARAQPYLYSAQEIQRLIEQALQLPCHGLRPWTYHALLGLLSVTGMRVGEALRLKCEDVDLDTGVLTVRGTKFGKSRLVPIHASTREVLARYRERRAEHLGGREAAHFFISSTGHPLDGGDVRRTFYDLSRQIGLRGPRTSHGPRLHDFRHRFAVETCWLGIDRARMPSGACRCCRRTWAMCMSSDTYWYLSAHPQLMATGHGPHGTALGAAIMSAPAFPALLQGLLHASADAAAPGQSPHHRLVP